MDPAGDLRLRQPRPPGCVQEGVGQGVYRVLPVRGHAAEGDVELPLLPAEVLRLDVRAVVHLEEQAVDKLLRLLGRDGVVIGVQELVHPAVIDPAEILHNGGEARKPEQLHRLVKIPGRPVGNMAAGLRDPQKLPLPRPVRCPGKLPGVFRVAQNPAGNRLVGDDDGV